MVTKDPMVTLGVDLASQPNKTGVCLIRWDGKKAHIERLALETHLDKDDLTLCQLLRHGYKVDGHKIDKIGIDAPFGWPACFTAALAEFSTSKMWPPDDDSVCECERKRKLDKRFGKTVFPHLRYRRTDEIVEREMVERWNAMEHRPRQRVRPLSVSSDRIAAPAMRAVGLLAERLCRGEAVDRSGMTGRFVEVYPAAALAIWGLRSSGYKGTKQRHVNRRKKLLKDLEGKTGLSVSRDHRELCWKSDDALDALVAALVARAKARSLCDPIPKTDGDKKSAKEEGWIALPQEQSLDHLAG